MTYLNIFGLTISSFQALMMITSASLAEVAQILAIFEYPAS
jgi:flagellar biosynthesis protein FliQ